MAAYANPLAPFLI